MNPNKTDQMARAALYTVLGSETIFFGTLLAAYMYLRADVSSWPLTHAPFTRLAVPAANTLLLLLSSLAAWLGLRAIRRGNSRGLGAWLLISLALGLTFIGGQIFEYLRSGMQPADMAFGGVFFALMGFHGMHLLAGEIVQAIVWLRSRAGDFSAARYTAVEMGAWFWFYVTGVWVVLFAVLYLV
jgi:cytochrome c oxidase subunit 3